VVVLGREDVLAARRNAMGLRPVAVGGARN